MSMHARHQVRDAAKADLLGLPTTGANVFTARVSPLAETELPGWKLMLRDETAEWDSFAGMIARSGRLVLEGWAQGGDGLEDKLDLMAAEAEAALYSSASLLNALLMNIGPPTTSVDLPEPAEGNSRRSGVVRILVPVTYRTPETDPTLIA